MGTGCATSLISRTFPDAVFAYTAAFMWADILTGFCSTRSDENHSRALSIQGFTHTSALPGPAALLPPNHLPILHHEIHILQQLDIPQWVTVNCDYIRECSRRNHSDLAFHVEHDRRA